MQSLEITSKDLQTCLNVKKSKSYELLKKPCELSASEAIMLFRDHNIYYKAPFKKQTYELHRLYNFCEDPLIYWKNLELLLSVQALSLDKLCHKLKIDSKALKSRWAQGKTPLIKDALSISKYFNISLALMFTKDIDFQCVENNFNCKMTKNTYIPRILTDHAGSRMRTFNHAYLFAKENLGKEISDEIIKSLQISKEALLIPETEISIFLFNLFHKKARLFNNSDEFFINMGLENIKNKNNKAQFSQFKPVASSKNAKEFYQKVNKYLTPKVDQNYDYFVKEISSKSIELHSSPKQRIIVNGKSLGSYEVMLYRFGHLIGAPSYIDLPMPSREHSTYAYNSITDEAIFTYIF